MDHARLYLHCYSHTHRALSASSIKTLDHFSPLSSVPSTGLAEVTNTMDEDQVKRQAQEAQEAQLGTLHQNAIGHKARKRFFFSSLDPASAEAVHKDAETVQYTPEEEVR